ncbi:class I SAM-dependent methyltransferase [Thermopetrobacter sp. TC1]|uniref:class I SAM-dependent methyltransferase n=1 Tax=Thermopetrobacter sp. TC1 TaxID=1495045 RepID=UPI00057047B1|nr:class I SAM-dependent methyltransferase [Thermopetrobacter sp. TC1]
MSHIRQDWSPETYDRHARFVTDEAREILNWLQPKPGERILDLGCGDGVIAERLMREGCKVVGVDISAEMLKAARARGVQVIQASGEDLPFENEFDAVFSNAALHWMTDARAVAEGVLRALRPGGRFVAEMGGHGNVATIVTALRAVARRRGANESLAGPWFFPTPAEYARLLRAVGFDVERIELVPRPTPLPGRMSDWLKVFRGAFFEQFGEDAPVVIAEVEDLLRPVLCDSEGNWTADYVRLRVLARKRK